MPEKTMDNTTNNTHTTAKPTEKIEETTRRYINEAETTARDAARTYNELIKLTTNFYFDAWGKAMSYGMELTKYGTESSNHTMAIYRRMYLDNYKAWETYWDGVNKLTPRPK